MLSKTQQTLYDAMLNGVEVVCTGTIQSYCIRTDTREKVTAAAEALIKKGLARTEGKYGNVRLVLK